jgi:ketosteroid isomerase-like protein
MRVNLTSGLILAVLATTAVPASSQDRNPGELKELQDTIMALDQALFNAFNACDLEKWRSYLDEDIEFYQDNDDVTTTRDQLESSFANRCNETRVTRLQRELLRETVEVHPIQAYGAVQLGTHRFWVVEEGKPRELASTPRFVHLWHNRAGHWRITRVISYGH